jgi:hypothetical protein
MSELTDTEVPIAKRTQENTSPTLSFEPPPVSVASEQVAAPKWTYAVSQHWPFILRENLPLILLVCLYANANLIVKAILGLPEENTSLIQLSGNLVNVFAALFLSGIFLFQLGRRIVWFAGHEQRFQRAWAEVRQHYCTFDRIVGCLIVWFLLTPFLSTAVGFREMIPALQPFRWDAWFKEADRVLHFGYEPWSVLHPFLAYPTVTWFIDRCYFAWLAILLVFPVGLSWSVRRRLRLQYLTSFMLTWIGVGTIVAIIFSSVGPCYYHLVGGDDSFIPLLTYLDEVHHRYFLWARFNQEGMWRAFIHNAPFGGITAMPSLHVAGVTLFALAARALNRWLGALFVMYGLVILLGSVHLGWHYAIDGYVSIVLTLAIWRLVGWGLDKAGWISLAQEEEMVRQLTRPSQAG